MALTAREWILLPKEEMEARKGELSREECTKLRLELDHICFSEDEKNLMSTEERHCFTHPVEKTQEEKNIFNRKAANIFRKMQEELAESTTSQ